MIFMCFMNMLKKSILNGYYLRKAPCVSWFTETKSDVQTQHRHRTKYGKDPPSRSSIRRWHKKFMETGLVLDAVKSSSSSEILCSMLSANCYRFGLSFS